TQGAMAVARSHQFLATGGFATVQSQYTALSAGRLRSHYTYNRVDRVAARPDSRHARYLYIKRELPHQHSHESAYHHYHHIHAVDLDYRHLWHELQILAWACVGPGVFRGAGRDDSNQCRNAAAIPLEKMVVKN